MLQFHSTPYTHPSPITLQFCPGQGDPKPASIFEAEDIRMASVTAYEEDECL